MLRRQRAHTLPPQKSSQMINIPEIRRKYISGELKVLDFVRSCKKIAEEKEEYGAYLEIFDDIEEQAAEAQKIIDEQGTNSPFLTGIPIAVKDNILIKGREASAASKILEGYIAPYDATVIGKLRKHNPIFFGRVNMDEFAMGGSTENSAYKVTRNPHDQNRVPGGTSGGSAAAVSLGTVPVAIGSDTGGSIRQPAAFCGVVGLKPTYGAVSRYGLMAMGSSLDQIGTFGNTVEDTEALFELIKGKDEKDSTSQSISEEFSLPETFKIGVPRSMFQEGVDKDLLERFERALDDLEKKGHKIIDIDFSVLEYSIPAYYIIMFAESSTNLSRYDGLRFGAQKEGGSFNESFIKTRTEGFGEEVRRRILLGTYVLSSGYIDAYYQSAQKARAKIRSTLNNVLKDVDVIAMPTTPTPAFKIGEKANDPLSLYLEDVFTVFANLTGNPGISVPMGTVEREGKELPVGIQFVAPHFREDLLFTIGKAVTGEEYTGK